MATEKKTTDEDGNFVCKNMCGILLQVKPKYIADVEFVLEVSLRAKILCSDSTNRMVTIQYPINVNLGPTAQIKSRVDAEHKMAKAQATSRSSRASPSEKTSN